MKCLQGLDIVDWFGANKVIKINTTFLLRDRIFLILGTQLNAEKVVLN